MTCYFPCGCEAARTFYTRQNPVFGLKVFQCHAHCSAVVVLKPTVLTLLGSGVTTQHNAVNRGPVLASVMMLRSPACCRCSSSRAGLGSREAPAAVFGGWSVLLETVSELSITFCIIASCNYTIAVQIGKQKTHDWHILLISWNRKKEKTCLWTLETQLKLTEQNI